jgi:hexosaminidase
MGPKGTGDEHADSAPALGQLTVTVADPSEELGLETCENYTLSVRPAAATLSACTVYGAMHGLETFAQLVGPGGAGYAVPAVEVVDFPRFHFRGLLIDTSRHFLPMGVLKVPPQSGLSSVREPDFLITWRFV